MSNESDLEPGEIAVQEGEARRSSEEEEKRSNEADDAGEPGGDLNISFESVKSKRGRPAVPEMWTRVISLQRLDLESIKLFQVNSDLLMEDALPKVPPKKRREALWAPLFLPSQWKEEHAGATLANYALTQTAFKKLCNQVVQMRQQLRSRALELDQQHGRGEEEESDQIG